MCKDFSDMHAYIEKVMGHPVGTLEMGGGQTAKEIREKAYPDFIVAINAAHAALERATREKS
jgi:hypothetical protein